MSDLLLELFSEEIPARMQRRAAEDLKKLLTDALVERGFLYEGAKAYSTPRRLTLHIVGLPVKGQDVKEERKGPRVGAPDAAVQGFLKAAGLASLDQAKIESDPKKGEFYVALIEKPGRATLEVLSEILPQIIRDFPWPKSMRWGAASAQPGALRWVRPLQSILCTFGPETEDTEVVPFEIGGVQSGNVTYGHRFLAPAQIKVRRFEDYAQALEKAQVVLDADRRKSVILHDAKDLAFAQGLELIEDEGLLDEVSGLVEYPKVLMGSFDEAFLDIPPEVIRTTIRANQKCFVLGKNGKLANKFLLTSNIEPSDGGAVVISGNERVIKARLSDAKFFWDTDNKVKLEERLPKLDQIVFHEKLGTQSERIARFGALAEALAPVVKADVALVARAAKLAKADLVTGMVGEFPELQGLMGRYYAARQGEHASVAAAAEEHYKPLGPSDHVPSDPVSVAVALADKIDILTGFWAIDEKPTGSKDPYALRRAGLGIIRILLENAIRLPLNPILWSANSRILAYLEVRGGFAALQDAAEKLAQQAAGPELKSVKKEMDELVKITKSESMADFSQKAMLHVIYLTIKLKEFLADRLKVYMRDQGARHDLIDAVFALPGQDDLLMVVRRIEALGRFLDTEDGKNLLAGYRRAANILRIEEKKDARAYDGVVDGALLSTVEEKALAAALDSAGKQATDAAAKEDFEGTMRALSQLRKPVDDFFEKVTVNADEPKLRENRLCLLNAIREATRSVADFSRIEG